MYKCNLCERLFSRKQDLTQHHNRLHLNTKYSCTLKWVQNQRNQQLNSSATLQQKSLPTLNNNVWNEIEELNVFSQITSISNKQNNEVFI